MSVKKDQTAQKTVNDVFPNKGEIVESKEIKPLQKDLVMSIKTLLPEDIIYLYGILSAYRGKITRSLEKLRKKDGYEKDPQYIFELSEHRRMDNVIKKLFALHARLKDVESEDELKANAGLPQQ